MNIVVTETTWLAKPTTLNIWPFKKMFADSYSIDYQDLLQSYSNSDSVVLVNGWIDQELVNV